MQITAWPVFIQDFCENLETGVDVDLTVAVSECSLRSPLMWKAQFAQARAVCVSIAGHCPAAPMYTCHASRPGHGAGALSPLAAICCGLCGGKGRWRSGDELGGGGAFVRAQLLL
jgi:hypothetical protein